MLNRIKLILYDLLAGRCDITFRSLPEFSVNNISSIETIIIYCSSTKIGDSVYIKHLVKSIKLHSDINIILLAKNNIIELFSNIENINLIKLSNKYGLFSVIGSQIKFRKFKVNSSNHLFINFDSEDFVEVPLFLRINNIKNSIGFGKERYYVFKYSFSNYFYCIDKHSFHQKINSILDLLNIKLSPDKFKALTQVNKIFVNQSGADDNRRFSKEQFSSILLLVSDLLPNASLIVSSFDLEYKQLEPKTNNIYFLPSMNLLELEKQVSECDMCITPDTSIAHISALSGLKTLIFYADNYYNNFTWIPNTPNVYTFIPNISKPLNKCSMDEISISIREFIVA